MITQLVNVGKSIYKYFPLPSVSIDMDGKVTIGLDTRNVLNKSITSERPKLSPTRVGCNLDDSGPFYESSRDKLWDFYFKYKNTKYKNTNAHDNNLLYADFIYFCSSKKTFIYHGLGSSPIELSKVKINIIREPYATPDVIASYKENALKLFKISGKIIYRDGKYENNASLRVDSIEDDKGNIVINCRKAQYFDQIGTNLIMDWKINDKDLATTLRTKESEVAEPGLLPALKDSRLANTIGVAVMLFDKEGNPLLRIRSKNLASITEGKLHCSASGVLEYPNGTEPGKKYDFSVLSYGMIKEIKDEIGLDIGEYDLYPVAFARELPRGGKPQIFFAAKTKLTVTDINKRMNDAKENYEYSSSNIDPNTWFEMSKMKEHYTYEGWACMYLAMQFAKTNEWDTIATD